jgi:hypothetical protein
MSNARNTALFSLPKNWELKSRIYFGETFPGHSQAKLDAANTQDRIAADLAAKEIEAEIYARKEASAIIIAEQGRWYTAIIRPLLAFPLIIYLWKVVVWDKVLGLGTTDPITGMVADWIGMIVTAYVGGRSIEKVARIFKR